MNRVYCRKKAKENYKIDITLNVNKQKAALK